MGIAAWGWDRNWVRQGRLAASSEVVGLGVGKLQNDQGNAAEGWQTVGTSASLTIETAAAVPWRALLLARTNLTPAATMRVRVGGPGWQAGPAALVTDSAAGALLGPGTTRQGAGKAGSTGAATSYRNAAGSSYVAPGTFPVRGGWPHVVTAEIARAGTNGTATAGSAIVAAYLDAAGQPARSVLPLSAVAQGTDWQTVTLTFTPPRDGDVTIYLAADTGTFWYHLGPASLRQVATHDSGTVPAGVEYGIGQALRILPAEVPGTLAQIDLADPTNPDGFLNVALAYAGPLTQTALNIGWGGGFGRAQGGQDVRTRSGATFTRLDWAARTRDIEHDGILADEVWPFVMALDLYARRGGNVLLIPDPDSPYANRETIFGRLTPTASVTSPYQTDERARWAATIEERL